MVRRSHPGWAVVEELEGDATRVLLTHSDRAEAEAVALELRKRGKRVRVELAAGDPQ